MMRFSYLVLSLLLPLLITAHHPAHLKWPSPSTSTETSTFTPSTSRFPHPIIMTPTRHPHQFTYVITQTSLSVTFHSHMYTFPSDVTVTSFVDKISHVMHHTCYINNVDQTSTLSSYLQAHDDAMMICDETYELNPFNPTLYHANIPKRDRTITFSTASTSTSPQYTDAPRPIAHHTLGSTPPVQIDLPSDMIPIVSQDTSNDDISPEKPYVNAVMRNTKEYPINSIDLLADTITGDYTWVKEYALNHFGKMHPFPNYSHTDNDTGIYDMNTGTPVTSQQYQQQRAMTSSSSQPIRIALVADWGAGTMEADLVSHLMMVRSNISDPFDPHYTIHIGDIYYVGTAAEVDANVLGIPPTGVEKGVKWPHGSLGSFALNGNHEMYSRGFGYFDRFLPTLGVRDLNTSQLMGQKASYFALSNADWRIIALDTGYTSYSTWHIDNNDNLQPDDIITWLNDVLHLSDVNDTRGIIFMSHHQAISAFDEVYLSTPIQLEQILPVNRTFLWLWGHEHRLAFYDVTTLNVDPKNPQRQLSLYSRCIGNGGYPTSTGPPPSKARDSTLQLVDERVYEIETGITKISVGYNGWTHLTLTGPELLIEYYSLAFDPDSAKDHVLSSTTAQLLVRETFNVQWGEVQLMTQEVIDPDITRVQHF